MAETFLTFQKFHDIEIANEIAEQLNQNGIQFLLEENQKTNFDPSFANNPTEPGILIKVRPEDFAIAHKALEDYYKKQLATVEPSYYLFEFSDEELMEIIAKPDEWGDFDYQLAQKILSDRGKGINSSTVQKLKEQRIDELSAPEKASNSLIIAGYFFALFGAVFGIVIGAHLSKSKKTLPNGKRSFVYGDEDRKNGKRILWMSLIILSLAVLMYLILYFKGNDYN